MSPVTDNGDRNDRCGERSLNSCKQLHVSVPRNRQSTHRMPSSKKTTAGITLTPRHHPGYAPKAHPRVPQDVHPGHAHHGRAEPQLMVNNYMHPRVRYLALTTPRSAVKFLRWYGASK